MKAAWYEEQGIEFGLEGPGPAPTGSGADMEQGGEAPQFGGGPLPAGQPQADHQHYAGGDAKHGLDADGIRPGRAWCGRRVARDRP